MNVARSILIAAAVAVCGVDLVVAGWQHLCCRHRIHSLQGELAVARLQRDEASADFTMKLQSLLHGDPEGVASDDRDLGPEGAEQVSHRGGSTIGY